MISRSLLGLITLSLLITVAGTAQPVDVRPYDGVLVDERLKVIVDAQSQRQADAVVRALEHEDAVVRARAALALGSIQSDEGLPHLVRLLGDSDAGVRTDAAFALGQLRDSTAARALMDALSRENDSRARHYIYQAMGESAGHTVAKILLGHEPDRPLTWSYVLSLARLGLRGVMTEDVAARIAPFLNHPDEEAQRHAGYFFWRVNSPASWSAMEDNIRATLQSSHPDDVSSGYLALALAVVGEAEDVPSIRMILHESTDWRNRDRAARALARYPAEDVVTDLIAAAADTVHHVAETAIRTIAGLDAIPDAHRPSLEALFESERLTTTARGHVALALARIGSYQQAYDLSAHASSAADAVVALGAIQNDRALSRLVAMARDRDLAISTAALGALRSRWTRERSDADRQSVYYDVFADAIRSLDVALIYTAAPLLSDSIFVSMGSASLMQEVFGMFEMPRDVEAAVAIVEAARLVDRPETRDIVSHARRHDHPAVRRAAGIEDPSAPRDLGKPDWQKLQTIGPRPVLRMHTDRGAIDLQLFADLAPVTVQTIIGFAENAQYDGVPFHRVVADFVIQGGDFAREDGFGGPGFELPSEFTPVRYATGTVGMASAGKDTEGSQFFLTHSMQPHLDGRYTAFGIVIDGQPVVDSIRRGDRILAIEILRDSQVR
jgi:cyclophilin family peptidyl-prolyl cis-trans isomerase/HEAT repeat protein